MSGGLPEDGRRQAGPVQDSNSAGCSPRHPPSDAMKSITLVEAYSESNRRIWGSSIRAGSTTYSCRGSGCSLTLSSVANCS
jgi:hypothetical protein